MALILTFQDDCLESSADSRFKQEEGDEEGHVTLRKTSWKLSHRILLITSHGLELLHGIPNVREVKKYSCATECTAKSWSAVLRGNVGFGVVDH